MTRTFYRWYDCLRRSWSILRAVALFGAVISCAPLPVTAKAYDATASEAKQPGATLPDAKLAGVTEFNTHPEEVTDAELTALIGAQVAAADVIAIGESVHGSAGLLRIQARLIRYLVVNQGIRLIVWENPTLRSLEFSRWVSSCTKAKTAAPIDVLYMPTAADLALWNWVCDFNHSQPRDPVIFRGMDVWDRPWEHYARIGELGARVQKDGALLKVIETSCPAYRAKSWAQMESLWGDLARDKKFLPAADYTTCRTSLTALLDGARQAASEKKKTNGPGADQAFEVALSASTLLGWLGYHNYLWSDDILSWNERDRAQGRNLMLIMEKYDVKRAVLAGHTSHVSHSRSPADWWGYGDLKSGVYFFAEMTRKKVFNVALTAYSASGTQGEWSEPSASDSLDKKLHDAGHLFSFFTSNAAFLAQHPKWWMQNQNFSGPYESGVQIKPQDHFDAFFFLKQSHLDKALPQRPMWEP